MASHFPGASPNVFAHVSISTAVAALLISFVGIALWLFGTEKIDPREPPLAPSSIPFIGHIIGLLWHHNDYFRIIT
jgi:hypothetical protein